MIASVTTWNKPPCLHHSFGLMVSRTCRTFGSKRQGIDRYGRHVFFTTLPRMRVDDFRWQPLFKALPSNPIPLSPL